MKAQKIIEVFTETSYTGQFHPAATRSLLGDIKVSLNILIALSILHFFI